MATYCPKCNSENRDTAHFCSDCGTPLILSKDFPAYTRTMETPGQELTRGTIIANRYEIIEELGAGGMGRVYRVDDTQAKEEIALKLINPEISADRKTIDRFRNELTTARKIRHKNICGMYDLGEDRGAYYITMEYVSGEDLSSLIRRVRIDTGTAVKIAKQICDGLEEAHRAGIIHRDLKPGNIMIDKEGIVRIMDFGIARSTSQKGITGTGVMIGTPEYMSPEQAESKQVDPRSDLYSLGVILFRMVTGKVPFEGETPLGVAIKHKSEKPKDPRDLNSQIPEELSRVILRCLEKDKEKRFQSAEELRSELEMIEQGIPTTERMEPKRKPLTSKEITLTFGRKKILITAVIVVIIVLAAIALWRFLPLKKAVPFDQIKPSIAVLPFDYLSPSQDEEYFCDGIHDEILTQLAKIKDLKVIARTSVIQYKNTEKRIITIGEELGVSTILEGTVRKSGSRIRISAQLIEVKTEEHLWVQIYDREYADIFSIQSDVAQKIADSLQAEFTLEEKLSIAKKPTENLEAYSLYLKANSYFDNHSMDSNKLKEAAEMYEKAAELDPGFVLALAKAARVHAMLYRFASWDRTPERLERCRAALAEATELAPEAAEVKRAHGEYLESVENDLEGALLEYQSVLQQRPNDAGLMADIGMILLGQGKTAEAIELLIRCYDRDPKTELRAYYVGWSYMVQRRWIEAERWLNLEIAGYPEGALAYYKKAEIQLFGLGDLAGTEAVLQEGSQKVESFSTTYYRVNAALYAKDYKKALNLVEADPVRPYYWKAQILELMGRQDEARSEYEAASHAYEDLLRERPEQPFFHTALGFIYAKLGRRDAALSHANRARKLRSLLSDPWASGEDILFQVAWILVALSENEEAIDHLETLLSLRCLVTKPRLRLEPYFIPLHDHPRFTALVSD